MQVLDHVKSGHPDLSLLSPTGLQTSPKQPACASDCNSEHDEVEDDHANNGSQVDATLIAGGKPATIDYRSARASLVSSLSVFTITSMYGSAIHI